MSFATLFVAAVWVTVQCESSREHIDLFKSGDLSKALNKYQFINHPWPPVQRGFHDDLVPYYKSMGHTDDRAEEQKMVAAMLSRLGGRLGDQWQQGMAQAVPVPQQAAQQMPQIQVIPQQMAPGFGWSPKTARVDQSLAHHLPLQQLLPVQVSEPEVNIRGRLPPYGFQDTMLTHHGLTEPFVGPNGGRYPMYQQFMVPETEHKRLAEARLADSLALQTLQQALRQPVVANAEERIEDSTAERIVNINDLMTDPSVRLSQLRPESPCLVVHLDPPSLPRPSANFDSELHNTSYESAKQSGNVDEGYEQEEYSNLVTEINDVDEPENVNIVHGDRSNYYQGATDSKVYSILTAMKKGRQMIGDSIRRTLESSAHDAETSENVTESAVNEVKDVAEAKEEQPTKDESGEKIADAQHQESSENAECKTEAAIKSESDQNYAKEAKPTEEEKAAEENHEQAKPVEYEKPVSQSDQQSVQETPNISSKPRSKENNTEDQEEAQNARNAIDMANQQQLMLQKKLSADQNVREAVIDMVTKQQRLQNQLPGAAALQMYLTRPGAQRQIANSGNIVQWEALKQALVNAQTHSPEIQHPTVLHPVAEKNFRMYQNIREAVDLANQRALQNKMGNDVKALYNDQQEAIKTNEPEEVKKQKTYDNSSNQDEIEKLRSQLGREAMNSARKYFARLVEGPDSSRIQRACPKKRKHRRKHK